MPNRDLNAKRYEIIFLERELLNAYYDVANLVSKNQEDSPEYKQAIDKLQTLYHDEQLYFLSLGKDNLETINELCDSFDGIDESKQLRELNDKNIKAIYDRVYKELSIGYSKRTIETELRNIMPAHAEIEPETLWKYTSEIPLFYEYYDILYKEQAGVYCTLEKIAAIHELTKKASSKDQESLNNEIFRVAFSNGYATEEFLERLSNKNFPSITEEEIDQDCQIMLGNIWWLKDNLTQTMDNEMMDLIAEYMASDNDLEKQIIIAETKQVLEYFQYEVLEDFREHIMALTPELLPIIEREMSIRNSYVHGKGECYDDYIIATEKQSHLIEELIQASAELLNLYYNAAFYEIEGKKDSDQYYSLIANIVLTQARETALLEDIIEDDELYLILEQTLATNEFENYFRKVKAACEETSPISEEDSDRIQERLQNLFYQYEEDEFEDEMDFSDENINCFLENGFDNFQPAERFDFYNQAMNIIATKKLDELIEKTSNNLYFIFLKYSDFYVSPCMDQLVVDAHFDSSKMVDIDEEYLKVVAEIEEVDYDYLKNTLAQQIQDNVKYQEAIVEELDENCELSYLTYLTTKIDAFTEAFPNSKTKANQKTFKTEN